MKHNSKNIINDFSKILSYISNLNNDGIFFNNTNISLDKLYNKHKALYGYKFNVEIFNKGYFIRTDYSSDYSKMYIMFKKFGSVTLKYSFNDNDEELEYYTNYNKYINITLDLKNKSIYCKNEKFQKYIPVTFNNIKYLITNQKLLLYVHDVLKIISNKNNSICFDKNDLIYSTSNDNIFSIVFFNSRKIFLKEINNNRTVEIPNWSLKTGSIILNIYIKICKKTEENSLGIVKNFFNKNHKILADYVNENLQINNSFSLINIIDLIYENNNKDLFKEIKKSKIFSESEYYDYCNTILKRRFKECKFNFKIKSIKRFKIEHDNLFYKIRVKEAKKIKLIKYIFNDNYKFLIDFFNKSEIDIKPISSNKQLLNFANYMNNCVYEYNHLIINSRCIVLNAKYKNERHCVLIHYNSESFELLEVKKRFNMQSNKKFETILSGLIMNLNKDFEDNLPDFIKILNKIKN
ncbi:hypothetical protein FHS04_002802 [Mesoflavibacter sabulilitoris]|uniref:Uncharacterized protein n=1 Tax=Mesoflavibacter zeaxanthinifaciens subsp. sabulilitoris TaxID=1520893 RepID=A0A2T1NNM7_9FLAO|nr:PcfJ domain-containing protein [Mesoflavibacter zeaxanthinifaciens]MBB3125258.1 hypothetical protein [Mesoflavibacter zeaxanthinifaciens subsp. sabulilitoris]PSG94493.1 hypothetical protein C7H61_00740 [Mesoflavibacter zeaxanthinifaciens subsp. sabulilitoris]